MTELYKWIEDHKLLHLCIDDVMSLRVGQELDVVIFDRNMEENGIWDKFKKDKKYNPEDFFKYNHHIIKYKGNFIWDIQFSWGETFEYPIHINVQSLSTNWNWIVLDTHDNTININNEEISQDESIPDGRKDVYLYLEDFPLRTRVGWRGSIMLWKHVKNKGQVYWKICSST